VTFRVLHGYGSATAVYEAARETEQANKRLTILYCGDWDCSGAYMSEVDLPERLSRYGANFDFERLALVESDCTSALPSFPASTKAGDERRRGDARYRWFVQRYGDRCWELDALDPRELRRRLEARIRASIDWDAWQRADVTERAEVESLTTILQKWPAISGQASKYDEGAV
jgi:hypothetical protein